MANLKFNDILILLGINPLLKISKSHVSNI